MALSLGKVVIHYNGTDKGPIYLKDCGQRNQLGGGKGIYTNGQDQYIDYGSDTTLVATADVKLSASVLGADSTGVIKAGVLNGTWLAEYIPDATGAI